MSLHVDCFTSLDDIKGRDRGNVALVLATIMRNGGRYSAFDASDVRMAGALTTIAQSGWTRRKSKAGYPWVEIELTDAGRAQMDAWQARP
jgi:hypothetical protein